MDGSPKWAALAARFVRVWKTEFFHAREDFWQEAKQSFLNN